MQQSEVYNNIELYPSDTSALFWLYLAFSSSLILGVLNRKNYTIYINLHKYSTTEFWVGTIKKEKRKCEI